MTVPTQHAVKDEFDRLGRMDYEFNRWFSERGQRENYHAMREAIQHHLRDIPFGRCLEVGCGPGTWTRVLREARPLASFTLVDLSKVMLGKARENLGDDGFTYVAGDFLAVRVDRKFDFFFSSRAIEYVPDQPLFVRKVGELLLPGGRVLIVTKNPHHLSRRLEGLVRSPNVVHSGQIAYSDLIGLLQESGFRDVKAFPCVVTFPPVRKSFWLSRKIWERIYRQEMRPGWSLLVESYIVRFTK